MDADSDKSIEEAEDLRLCALLNLLDAKAEPAESARADNGNASAADFARRAPFVIWRETG